VSLTPGQIEAAEAPFDAPLALSGAAGTGKTRALLARVARLHRRLTAGERIVVSTAAAVEPLRRKLGDLAADPRIVCAPLGAIAAAELARGGVAARHAGDGEAALAFERAAAELVDEAWALDDESDPEVSGVRSPIRFRLQAFRLFRKLRMARIEPDAFEDACRRGLTQFYGKPPNFANPALIARTKEQYRDSLLVDGPELERQRDRERDLIKLLRALYDRYLIGVAGEGVLTDTEALIAGAAAAQGPGFAHAFVDDAQDLSGAELAWLRAIAGDRLTFAGDAASATRGFAGRNARALDLPAAKIELRTAFRTPAIAGYRAPTQALEAKRLAEDVGNLIAAGTPASEIAVIARDLRGIDPYLQALLARGIAVELGGGIDLFEQPVVADLLGALWSIADPYRHDWLMRNFEAPWLNFSDATIAQLCADPPDAQPLLFELPGEEIDASPSRRRSDPGRALRCARNALRGDADAALDEETRERLNAFRDARRRWLALERTLGVPDLIGVVAAETVLPAVAPGPALGLAERLCDALIAHASEYAAAHPFASLHDYLRFAQALAELEDEPIVLGAQGSGGVAVLDVEASKGREFERVFVVNARAGAFPCWYVPDAFVFLPSLGIVAKENVGEGALAARTAKFTYAMHRNESRERFNAEERRAFRFALSRARLGATALASGAPTRGETAPEFLTEI
jgi:superfamily I DNA/RNA helicase